MEDLAYEIRMKAQGLEEMTIGQTEFSMEEINEIIRDSEDLFKVAFAYRLKVEEAINNTLP